MNRLLAAVLCSMIYGFALHAEEAVQGGPSTDQPQAQSQTPSTADETGGGEADDTASVGSSYHGAGFSWRNVQQRLQSKGLIKCHLGGTMAKNSIPYLESAGFCNVLGKAGADTNSLPEGTVWVYSDGRYGNTIIKLGRDQFFDNRMSSALPHPRNQKLIGIMKPKCGKVTQVCAK